jgi:hypothetical protein
LANGEAIHQQLHISEFDSSGKEGQVRGDIPLPPKDVADIYIEGQLFYVTPKISLLAYDGLTLSQHTSPTRLFLYFIALHFKRERI